MGLAPHFVDLALQGLDIGKDQLRLDDADVAYGVDTPFDMHDIVIVETAHDVQDGIGLADVGEELVAKPLAFARAPDKTGDVDKVKRLAPI